MSTRAAVKLAQAMLAAAGADVKEDGILGGVTISAYDRASPAIRDAIQDAVNRWEQLDFARMVEDRRRALGSGRPLAKTQDLTKPAMIGSAGSGWEGRLASRMRAAGVPEKSLAAIAHQVKVETSGRLTVSESHRYDPNWLRKNMRVFRGWTNEEIRDLQARGPAAFFDVAYGDRADLGNKGRDSGDGFKYRGRGPFQLTGRNNYERVGRVLGVDLVSDPDWIVRSEDNAMASAVAYLKMSGKLKQPLNVAQIGRLVNPGLA